MGVAGCSPQSCDPSQAGFLSGIGCEASGSYATRNQAQRAELANQNLAAMENRRAAADEGDNARRALVGRAEARRRLVSTDRETAQLRARLASARARGADQARTQQAQSELDAMQGQRAALANGATPEQLRAYEERHRRMMDSLQGI